MTEYNLVGNDDFTCDFVLSFTCNHTNPDTGVAMSEAEERIVYQLAHLVPRGLRFGYNPWRITQGPWENDFQGTFHVNRYRERRTEEQMRKAARTEPLPASRHNISCPDCGTTVPLLQFHGQKIFDRLLASGVETISLRGLKLAAQATS